MTAPYTVHTGDCRDVLRDYPADHFDSIVSDPPYGLTFMGKGWDRGVPGAEFWQEALRVAKPGAHLLAFGGTRTFHRLTVAIEDAGWEVRDCMMWIYATGFPKSHNFGCKCGGQSLPYDHATQPTTEHNLSRLHVADVSPTSRTAAGQGQVLLSRVSQHRASTLRQARPESEVAGSIEPGMEGGRDIQTQQGQLHQPEVRSMPRRVTADGAQGRLHHGASTGDGDGFESPADARRGGASHRPQHAEQHAVESDAVRVEPGSQALRSTCARCGGLTAWQGWGTALKPAWEPVIVARKPLSGTVADNVLRHGTGALNIDGCRVGGTEGRWPANVMHDGSDEVVEGFPESKDGVAVNRNLTGELYQANAYGVFRRIPGPDQGYGGSGSAARFFYCAKASRTDREEGCDNLPARSGADAVERDEGSAGMQSPRAGAGRTADTVRNFHPTVKPTDLMRYLCRLVTPPNGLVLDPFCGSGSTGKAALLEGLRFVGVDLDPAHVAIAEARCQFAVDTVAEQAAAAEAPGAQLALF